MLNSLWVHYMSIDKLALSVGWAERMLETGKATADGDLLIVGHRAMSGSAYWQGKLKLARHHGDVLQAMYDPQRHWHVAQIINTDPFTGEAVYRGMYLWMLGYPDQAIAASNARDEHARRRGHPFDLAFALTLGAQVYEFLNMPEELERRADEANAVGRQLWRVAVLRDDGRDHPRRRLAARRPPCRCREQIDRSATRLAATGHGVWISYLQALRGEALAHLGDLDGARDVIDSSIAHIEQGEERCHYPEVIRLRGWLAEQQQDAVLAEDLYRRSIAIAREQEAKSWELRTTTSLAALLAKRGRQEEARAMLVAIHGWFTEGFATHDLKAAAALLKDIAFRTQAASASPPEGERQLRWRSL